MEERRFQKRLEIDLDAVCRLMDKNTVLKDVRVVNINHSGMCLLSEERQYDGQKIEADLTLDNEEKERAVIHVEVVWCAPTEEGKFRVGVKVIEENTEDLERFRKFYSLQLLYPPKDL